MTDIIDLRSHASCDQVEDDKRGAEIMFTIAFA